MPKSLELLALVGLTSMLVGQTPDHSVTQQDLKKLEGKVIAQVAVVQRVQKENLALRSRVKELETNHQSQTEALQKDVRNLGQQTDAAKNQLGGLEVKTRWQIATLAIGFGGLLLGALGMFLVIRRKEKGLEARLSESRSLIDQESLKIDERLVTLLNNQMRLLENHPAKPANEQKMSTSIADHSLGLRVGEEIYRMRFRLNSMTEDTRGIKPLLKSLERLEEDFNRQGYELVDLLNRPFTDQMIAKTRFIPSDDLAPGERIITRVVKPPILYKGKVVELPEIEVSTGA